jgi:UDP-N-acetylmuramate dehydrogenase
MLPEKNISLQPYHCFASTEKAQFFMTIDRKDQIVEAVKWAKAQRLALLILGAGSNVLFTKDFEGIVAKMELMGIKKVEETASEVVLEVGAGENWHHFVSYCVQKGWGGIENLSLIPGTVGASPIQNIGAYGVEVQECIKSVAAYDTLQEEWILLQNKDCAFGYRNSLFKASKNRYIITQVTFKLHKQPKLKTDYGAIREVLHEKGIRNPSLENIAQSIIQIRTLKLPDPKVLGNAGSFFKNPTVSKAVYEELFFAFPQLIAYPISDNDYKIAAGWLIEACNWKGVRKGNVGCYEKQALVIVSYGIVSGKEVYDFSEEIIHSVNAKFNILLEREVNVF